MPTSTESPGQSITPHPSPFAKIVDFERPSLTSTRNDAIDDHPPARERREAARPRDELLERAVSLWSAVHGFASLRSAGVLTNIPGLPAIAALEERLVAQVRAAVR